MDADRLFSSAEEDSGADASSAISASRAADSRSDSGTDNGTANGTANGTGNGTGETRDGVAKKAGGASTDAFGGAASKGARRRKTLRKTVAETDDVWTQALAPELAEPPLDSDAEGALWQAVARHSQVTDAPRAQSGPEPERRSRIAPPRSERRLIARLNLLLDCVLLASHCAPQWGAETAQLETATAPEVTVDYPLCLLYCKSFELKKAFRAVFLARGGEPLEKGAEAVKLPDVVARAHLLRMELAKQRLAAVGVLTRLRLFAEGRVQHAALQDLTSAALRCVRLDAELEVTAAQLAQTESALRTQFDAATLERVGRAVQAHRKPNYFAIAANGAWRPSARADADAAQKRLDLPPAFESNPDFSALPEPASESPRENSLANELGRTLSSDRENGLESELAAPPRAPRRARNRFERVRAFIDDAASVSGEDSEGASEDDAPLLAELEEFIARDGADSAASEGVVKQLYFEQAARRDAEATQQLLKKLKLARGGAAEAKLKASPGSTARTARGAAMPLSLESELRRAFELDSDTDGTGDSDVESSEAETSPVAAVRARDAAHSEVTVVAGAAAGDCLSSLKRLFSGAENTRI